MKRTVRYTLLCACAAVCLMLASCARLPGRGGAAEETAAPSPAPAAASPAATEQPALPEWEPEREDMDGEELYELFLQKLSDYAQEIVLNDVAAEDAAAAYRNVLRDHPELFWVRDGYSWSLVSSALGSTLTFTPVINEPMESVPERQRELDAAAEAVLALTDDGMTDFEKALTVHDWLVENTEYDSVVYDLIQAAGDETIFTDSLTAYGCLVKGTAVCSGYAQAFQLLMNRLGIECGRVAGTGMRGESHEWNYICLDGDYYWIDVTWDDPVTEGDPVAVCSHEFFCITDAELLRTHVIGAEETPPRCAATAYDYFIYYGLCFEDYDPSALGSVPLNDQGAAQVKFTSELALNDAVEHLFGAAEAFDVFGADSEYVRYTVGESGLVLSIGFV